MVCQLSFLIHFIVIFSLILFFSLSSYLHFLSHRLYYHFSHYHVFSHFICFLSFYLFPHSFYLHVLSLYSGSCNQSYSTAYRGHIGR